MNEIRSLYNLQDFGVWGVTEHNPELWIMFLMSRGLRFIRFSYSPCCSRIHPVRWRLSMSNITRDAVSKIGRTSASKPRGSEYPNSRRRCQLEVGSICTSTMENNSQSDKNSSVFRSVKHNLLYVLKRGLTLNSYC